MKLSIRIKDVPAAEDVKSHVQRRAAFALSRFGDRVLAADVLVEEVIQRRGGRDNRCQYKIKLRRLEGPLMAEVVHSDVFAAIDLASDRVGRAVARAIDGFSSGNSHSGDQQIS